MAVATKIEDQDLVVPEFELNPTWEQIFEWHNTPTKINKEAKDLLIEYLSETYRDIKVDEETGEVLSEKTLFKNNLERFGLGVPDLGKTLELIYQIQKGVVKPDIPKQKSTMSKECKEWAGLTRYDPYVPFKHRQFGREICMTWGWLSWNSFSDQRFKDRTLLIQCIQEMPENE